MTQSNLLSEVPSGNYFRFPDGREARNLEELYNIVSTSDPSVFTEHVTSSKDDFSEWIRNCVLHVALADKLSSVKKMDEYFRILSGEITNLKMGNPATVPADDGLGSIDAELNSVLDEEILAAMNDEGPADVSAPIAQPTTPPPVVSQTAPAVSSPPIVSAPMSTASLMPSENHIEEKYEYEEVFKPLVEELRNDVFSWEG